MIKIPYHVTDFLFRFFFSLIFIGLGGEHIVDDHLIQKMMPDYLEPKELLSKLAGVYLLGGGFCILFGLKTRVAALFLALFLLVVTPTVHIYGLVVFPEEIPKQWDWLWDIFQRSNLVKNLCLLGVCFHLFNHETGKWSLDAWLAERNSKKSPSTPKP